MAQVRGKPAAGASIRYFADRLGNPDVPSVFDFGEAKIRATGWGETSCSITSDRRRWSRTVRFPTVNFEGGRSRCWPTSRRAGPRDR